MDKEDSEPKVVQVNNNLVPREYELTNDQILNFSINEFDNLATPSYFHLKNVQNLIKHMTNEIRVISTVSIQGKLKVIINP